MNNYDVTGFGKMNQFIDTRDFEDQNEST